MTDKPAPEFTDYTAYTERRNADHRHAITLVTTGRAMELVALLANYAEPFRTAFGALSYALQYSPYDRPRPGGYISPKQACAILAGIGSAQPEDADAVIRAFMEPLPCKPEGQATHWPINRSPDQSGEDCVWGLVIGIERGWFAYNRAGFLQWTIAGRNLYGAGAASTFVESDTGQGAFSF
jgi:hypothetical protein